RIIACLSLAQCLAGCVVTGYEKPDLALEIPDHYTTRRGDTAPPELDWWRGFRSRELTDLVETAQAQNFDIAVAIAQIEQADALVRVAGAPLFPALDANASATRSQTSARTTTTGTGRAVTSNLFNANLSASYVLDVWGKNRANLLAAEQNSIVERYNREV